MELRTDSVFQALKSPLTLVESPERRKELEAYVEAARPPLERSVFDLLSQLTDALSAEVSPHYEVTLGYRPGALDLAVRTKEEAGTAGETWSVAEGEVEKITLRIPAELKDLATQAAAAAGLSVNSWFVRVLARALRTAEGPDHAEEQPRHRRHARRVTGWIGRPPEG